MSRFVRSASWLRHLFTPSHTAQPGPVEVSDDVSLVQPYDGGGYPLFDPGQWSLAKNSLVGVSSVTKIYTVPSDNIVRLLGLSATRVAGAAPDCNAEVETPNGINTGLGIQVTGVGSTFLHHIPASSPILGPGHILLGRHLGGDASTVVQWNLYFVQAPIGAVFYL